MHYEHLVQINDPQDPLLTPLSRLQLWRGLLRRVERPDEFLVGVESVRFPERGTDWVKREMQLGTLLVCDHIRLHEGQSIEFDTAPSAQHQGGKFSMRIEEPAAGELFVRFAYQTPLRDAADGASAEELQLLDFLRNAYRDTDVDAIRWIRELAETGQLDEADQAG